MHVQKLNQSNVLVENQSHDLLMALSLLLQYCNI